jgi:hypothetical protein
VESVPWYHRHQACDVKNFHLGRMHPWELNLFTELLEGNFSLAHTFLVGNRKLSVWLLFPTKSSQLETYTMF